jgi:hypothetical protein
VTSDYTTLACNTIVFWLKIKATPTIHLIALSAKPFCCAAASLMAYNAADLKANIDEASFRFTPNTIGHTSDRNLPLRTSIKFAFYHNATNHNNVM